MPQLAKRPCSAYGCPVLVTHGRCPLHQQQRNVHIDDRRVSSSKRGYDAAWRRLRLAKLAEDPLCQINTHCQHPTAASEVDHIIPIAARPDLRLEWSNLQSACHACHSAKTMRESVRQ